MVKKHGDLCKLPNNEKSVIPSILQQLLKARKDIVLKLKQKKMSLKDKFLMVSNCHIKLQQIQYIGRQVLQQIKFV